MAITAATLQTLIEAGNAAVAAGDWATAHSKFVQAKGQLVAIANGGAGDVSMQFDKNAIDSLIDECKQQMAAAPAANQSADTNSSIKYGRYQYVAPRGAVGVED